MLISQCLVYETYFTYINPNILTAIGPPKALSIALDVKEGYIPQATIGKVTTIVNKFFQHT